MSLRKERNLSFEQLSKALSERGTHISHTNLKNYEILDPEHPIYARTRSMSIEYLVGFADFYDVSIDYLLGISNSKKNEYSDISERLGLSDDAIDRLVQCKDSSEENGDVKPPFQRDTVILNNLLTSDTFDYVMEKIKLSLFADFMYKLSQNAQQEFLREQNATELEKSREFMNRHGYFPVENDVIASVHMENAIGELGRYLRELSKHIQ